MLNVSLICLPDHWLLVYKNARVFCILILYLETSLNTLKNSDSFLEACMWFSMCSVMIVICKPWQFYFFSNLNWFYIFLSSACHGKTLETKLNKSGKREHSCLVPDLRGNAFSFSPLRMMFAIGLSSVEISSVTQLCLILWNPKDCSTPGFPVHHQLPELTQTHVHWIGVSIQPSHPLSSPSPQALNIPQHQALFQWVSSSHKVAKVLEFQLQHEFFQWIFRTGLL